MSYLHYLNQLEAQSAPLSHIFKYDFPGASTLSYVNYQTVGLSNILTLLACLKRHMYLLL